MNFTLIPVIHHSELNFAADDDLKDYIQDKKYVLHTDMTNVEVFLDVVALDYPNLAKQFNEFLMVGYEYVIVITPQTYMFK